MTSLFTSVRCLSCGHQMAADLHTATCEACGGGWVEARYDLDRLPADWPAIVAQRPTTLWRYRELLPFDGESSRLTMGEGWTPFTRAFGLEEGWGQGEIWVKDERQHPTGSLKDRQAAFTVSALKSRGIEEMVLASTGNAAAAYAAYCARADLKLWVFLPSSVPAEKMRELGLYGAEVVKVAGTYDQTKQVAADFAARRDLYKDRGAKAIPGKESMKTIALEIAEQLGQASGRDGWLAPDWYVQAVSGGIGPLGVLKGFVELREAGITDRVPKLGIIQAEGCAPMARAWQEGLAEADPVEPDTLVTVLATGKPGMAYHILKEANDRYGGAMVAVSDGEAFRAMRRVARTEGFSMEPAASVAFAGLQTLLDQAYIQPGERVVVNCSGHTFSAEKHALEDRYAFHLRMADPLAASPSAKDIMSVTHEGLATAFEQLDEQITTIVVIDDNPSDSRLIRRLLQTYKQYRIFEAHTGQDGLDLVRQRQPDLVILDLRIPDMNGFAILDELKADEETAHIPVVIISARSLAPAEAERLERYTDSIWQKGNFSAHELAKHVITMLGDDMEKPAHHHTPGRHQIDHAQPTFGQDERRRILVVDDYVSDARLMRRLFEANRKFEVVEAHSGEEALDALDESSPDLIILDLILPDTNGEDLLRYLRERDDTQDVPVVIISAKDIDPGVRAQLIAQVDSVWKKAELDRSSLLAHVETIFPE